jgi:uncharacterized repeat protein (TIGR03803 family)
VKPGSRSFIGKHALVFGLLLGLMTFILPSACAQSFSVVHSFGDASDGANPFAGLVIDGGGNLYGVTWGGGSFGTGTVFELRENGEEKVLYNFTGGSDGANPYSGLILDADGNLYGTTSGGGADGFGTVFKLSKGGKEEVLHGFESGADGANPEGSLTMDADGNLYGTTFAGGASGTGAVFRVTKGGEESILYSFAGGTDGANPVAGLTFSSKGDLFGTTSAGGTYGDGTVFLVAPSKSGWKETVVHNFALQSDGGVPYAGLVLDHSGNLYGAATEGGDGGSSGGGIVFELSASGSGWTFQVLSDLAGWGISGTFRNVLLDASGNIYATTHCDGSSDAGTVYELVPSEGSWNYSQLYAFTGGTDGLYSFSNLVLDSAGNLYGTTAYGGANGSGAVFKVTP